MLEAARARELARVRTASWSKRWLCTYMAKDWRFVDPPNAASFTTQFVLEGSPILRVYHDYDGDWQFHGTTDHPTTTEICRLVSL